MICASWFGASFEKDFLYHQFFQKTNKTIRLNYYDTKSVQPLKSLSNKYTQSVTGTFCNSYLCAFHVIFDTWQSVQIGAELGIFVFF